MAYYSDAYLAGVAKCVNKAIAITSLGKTLRSAYRIEQCHDCSNPVVESAELLEWQGILEAWDNVTLESNVITEAEFKLLVADMVIALSCVPSAAAPLTPTDMAIDIFIGTGTNYTITNNRKTMVADFLIGKVVSGLEIESGTIPLTVAPAPRTYTIHNPTLGTLTLACLDPTLTPTWDDSSYVRIEFAIAGSTTGWTTTGTTIVNNTVNTSETELVTGVSGS